MRSLVLTATLLLCACAPGMDRRAYLNTLIGQPESVAVQQLGVPSRAYETSGHKYLAFLEQRQDYLAGGPFLFGGGFYGRGFGYGAVFPSEVINRVCETTLDIANGRVLSWSLRGNACG